MAIVKSGTKSNIHIPIVTFFDIVGEVGCKVILGIDAHSPDDFNQDDFEALEKFAWRHKLNVINIPEFKKGK